jgi:hypothetical protein
MSQHFHVNCKFLGCWREFGANEYDGVAADWFATDSQKSIRTENESLFWRVLKTTCGHLTNRWFAAHGDFLRTSIFLCHIHFFYIYYIYYSLLSFFVLNICYIYHIYYHLCTTIYYNDDHLLLSSIIITIIIYYYHLFPLLGIQWWFTSIRTSQSDPIRPWVFRCDCHGAAYPPAAWGGAPWGGFTSPVEVS